MANFLLADAVCLQLIYPLSLSWLPNRAVSVATSDEVHPGEKECFRFVEPERSHRIHPFERLLGIHVRMILRKSRIRTKKLMVSIVVLISVSSGCCHFGIS